MRKPGNLWSILCIALAMQSCGKFADKFGRDKSQYTRVNFEGQHGSFQTSTALDSGMMIYFARAGVNAGGIAFGFVNASDVQGKSVVVPNGNYNVYAITYAGSTPFTSTSYCGTSNGGNTIALSGASTTISIDLTTPNCNHGGLNPFSTILSSDNGNFDTISVTLCSDKNHPSCTAVTSSSISLKISMLGGEDPGNGVFTEFPEFTRTSTCYSFSGGTAATGARIPVGGTGLAPPVKLEIYGASSSCAGAISSTYMIADGGLKKLYNAVSGSDLYFNSPVSQTHSVLSVFKNF